MVTVKHTLPNRKPPEGGFHSAISYLPFPGFTTGTFITTVVAGCVLAYAGVTILPVLALMGIAFIGGLFAMTMSFYKMTPQPILIP
jgi:hypothetical protein